MSVTHSVSPSAGVQFIDYNLQQRTKNHAFVSKIDIAINVYVSLRLRMQNAVSAQPCVGKFRISLVLLNFLHCNFRLWFETP